MKKSRHFRRITNKNIQELMEVSPSSATRALNRVRALYKKEARSPVYLVEFCEETGFDIDKVCAFFNWD